MAGPGSRGQEQVLCKENVVTAWEKRLADAVSVFQPLNAMHAPELRNADPNCSTLPNRLGGAGVVADDSRFPTLDLTTGLGKPAGRQALSPPQVLHGAQQWCSTGVEGHQEAMNMVMQVLKEAEESDAILWRNLAVTKKRRTDQLRVVLNKINDGKETATLLFEERMGFRNKINAWKQEMILQKQKYDRIITEMQDERKKSEILLVQKHEKFVSEMQEAPRKEAETLLIQEHEKIIAEMREARKEAETLLIQKHEKIVTEMKDARKEAEITLIQKHEKIVLEMQEARKEAETQLIQEQEIIVIELQDAHEADTRLLEKYDKKVREFEMQEARKKADQIMFVHNNKKLLSAQVDAQRKAEIQLIQKHNKTINEMLEAHIESEKILVQKHEKRLAEVDSARKESETRLLKEHKVEVDARKEREKEMLQKHSDLEAEVVKFTNMYYMALTSYNREKEEKTITEKEHAEAKQAMHAQLDSLQSQLAAVKDEKSTRENEHVEEAPEEAKRAMNAEPESQESQLAAAKDAVTTVSEKDLQLSALQSQLVELQEDKVKLQEALDALRDHQKSRIKSESDRVSIEILWEVAQKVLTFPEDVRDSQSVNTSGYETLLSSREENSVDKMAACVNAALKEAVRNWKTAQDDVEKIKGSFQKHIVDAIAGRKDLASDDVQSISDGSEINESMEKKRKGLAPPQTQLSRRKRMTPQRFVPGS